MMVGRTLKAKKWSSKASPKTKREPEIDVAEEGGEEPSGQGEQGLSRARLQHEQGEDELQPYPGRHQTQVHPAAVGAQGEGQTDHHQEPEEADEPFHGHQA